MTKPRKLFYMGLESYEERYTLQLTEWCRRAFDRRGWDVVYVPGQTIDNSKKISVGQVLDAHGRSFFSMSQMMNLVQMMQAGQVTSEDVIFFEDMFAPGIESLPYILNQVGPTQRPRVFVRCLAQTVDPDDFVHVWGMSKWMSHYERLVNEFATVLATNEEMVANMRVAGWTAPIYNVSGLAFNREEVLERLGEPVRPFEQRAMRVAFGSRRDQEKQPDFYMDLIEQFLADYPEVEVEFALMQGGALRSNQPGAVERARELAAAGKLDIYENLKKHEYYALLNDSRVMINTALQDWVSNGVGEADTLGANLLFPAYRSFPETLANDPDRMYIPWSLDDACEKLLKLLKQQHYNAGRAAAWVDGTVDRIMDIIEGCGEQWRRDGADYRKHTREYKY